MVFIVIPNNAAVPFPRRQTSCWLEPSASKLLIARQLKLPKQKSNASAKGDTVMEAVKGLKRKVHVDDAVT